MRTVITAMAGLAALTATACTTADEPQRACLSTCGPPAEPDPPAPPRLPLPKA